MKRTLIAAMLVTVLWIAPAEPAWAQTQAPQAPGQGGGSPGPGMHGPGMHGPGMGPGMMGQGMGPGMMGPGMGGGMSRPGMGRMGRGGGRAALSERPLISLMLRDRQQLGLNDEQVAKFRDLRSGFQKDAIRAGAEIRILEIDLDDLLDQDKVDLAKVEAAVRKQQDLRTNLRLGRIKAIEQAKALLTDDQRQRLRTIVETMPGVGSGGRGMMGAPP